MGIEFKLQAKIDTLEKKIIIGDEWDWLHSPDDRGRGDSNEYFWKWCGERKAAQGKLDAFKEALEIVRRG